MPSPSRVNENAASTVAGRLRRRRPLTERERAAKAERVAAYEERCEALKNGTFKGVVELAAESETEHARQRVVAEMANAVYGQRLTRFIGQRPGVDPCRLLVVIGNWKRTNGIVDHVAPTT